MNGLDNVAIGKLTIVYRNNWEQFKRKRPLLYDELDYAVVKELDDIRLLIEESRLNKILQGLHV